MYHRYNAAVLELCAASEPRRRARGHQAAGQLDRRIAAEAPAPAARLDAACWQCSGWEGAHNGARRKIARLEGEMMPPKLPQTQRAARAQSGQVPLEQAASAGQAQTRAAPGWEAALLQDLSPTAILPNDPELVAGLRENMRNSFESAYAHSTNRSDTYFLTAWA
jgi:hypothetical protein